MNEQRPSPEDTFSLVITEYPKSGATWLVTLLGDLLMLPKRDLYITQERVCHSNNTFYKGILDHHWYKGATSLSVESPSVVKSHELPHSPLIDFNAKFLHLIRDGRDSVVSKYFYEKDFCVNNGLISDFDVKFDDYLVNSATEWKTYVESWLDKGIPVIKYEALLQNTKQTLIDALAVFSVEYDPQRLDFVIADNIKDKFRAKLEPIYKYNTFVRKAIVGDWKNHFTKRHTDIFNAIAGDTLIKLGYETRPLSLFRRIINKWKR
jgi:hypothetical protein